METCAATTRWKVRELSASVAAVLCMTGTRLQAHSHTASAHKPAAKRSEDFNFSAGCVATLGEVFRLARGAGGDDIMAEQSDPTLAAGPGPSSERLHLYLAQARDAKLRMTAAATGNRALFSVSKSFLCDFALLSLLDDRKRCGKRRAAQRRSGKAYLATLRHPAGW